ncbi:F-box/FBD/LRR-repeat protein At5g22660-like [Vicia villosa]|uniref:F-box/FBD/LRR-repeat protein At5g22660-like n=1 Tax=Vicia villosa TaxID=3911 RepID=UPI00273A9047|nr:F-box/FBD/LRR-repeat protein At5g22660-like [Vicia villosa]
MDDEGLDYSIRKKLDTEYLRDMAQLADRVRQVKRLKVEKARANKSYKRKALPTSNITKWVNFVIQRRVEYLFLRVNSLVAHYPELPIAILTCKTLVVLKLSRFCMKEDYSVALPSLKTLRLKNISFPKLRDFMLFLTGCPILEDLHLLTEVTFGSDESLTVNEWKGFCLSNLTRADIHCAYSYFPLKAFHNVHSLRFQIDQVVHYQNDLIPTFHNLTQLELISLRYSCQFLVEVLNHCPKLQKLDLRQANLDKIWNRKKDRENWVDPVVVPQCLALHLKTCNLFNFFGLPDELMLASYILKNASILQTMKIWNCGHSKNKRIISSFPRASSTCKLTVIYLAISFQSFI